MAHRACFWQHSAPLGSEPRTIYGLHSYCSYSYGLHSYGLHSYGLYSYGRRGDGYYEALVPDGRDAFLWFRLVPKELGDLGRVPVELWPVRSWPV